VGPTFLALLRANNPPRPLRAQRNAQSVLAGSQLAQLSFDESLQFR
jgi:hypothetical protein